MKKTLLLLAALVAPHAHSVTFTVISTNDAGPGTLRQAILDSNASISSSNNLIAFNIPETGLRTIKLLSALPAFSQAATIDGFTQPGASANTLSDGNNANWLIEVRGVGKAFLEKTFHLNVAGTIIRGLRISGSSGLGVEMVTSNCVVAGCFIYSNGAGGIMVYGGNANRIGGLSPAERNVISGHGGSRGIEISYANGNAVLGNIIGPDLAGGNSLGFQFSGVSIFGGSGNMIGDGTVAGGNIIAFHSAAAVSVESGANNPVRGNRIFSNVFGIDLGFSGVQANDAGDQDEGANNLQNFPILTNATVGADSTVIEGTFSSHANTAYTLEFFANTACGSSGHGQGEFYLGSASVMTPGSGNVDFTVTIPVPAPGAFITGTATDPGNNTSEFSACRQAVVNLPPQIFTVTNTNDSGPGSLRQMILDSAVMGNDGADRIHFNIPGAGPHQISLLSTLPSPAQPLVIDGFTQPGASANTSPSNDNAAIRIQLDNAQNGFGTALIITNENNTIRGLSFTRASDTAIYVRGVSNVIEGNWIGIDPDGAPAENGLGVVINRAFNLLGGTNLAARNIISANSFGGVWITGTGASNNVVAGNYIGPGTTGTNNLGNLYNGVTIRNGVSNTIGGLNLTAGNVIAFNEDYGVSVESGRQNGIFNNIMHGHGVRNIRVFPGANDNIQPPVLTAAFTGSTVVRGIYEGKPNTWHRIEAYSEINLFGFGYGGTVVVGSFMVMTDAAGKVEFEHTFEDFDPTTFDRILWTTISCENNTSQESNTRPILPGGTSDLQVSFAGPTSGNVADTNLYTITVTNDGPATATGVLVEGGFPPTLNIFSIASSEGSWTVSNGVIEFDVQVLPPGETATITFSAQPTGSLPIYMTARASADQPDAFSENNTADIDFFVTPVTNRFDLLVTPDWIPGFVRRGETGTWVSHIQNDGPETAAGVKSYHYLPPGARPLVSMSSTKGTCFPSATPPRCEVDNLAPGEGYDVTITFPVGDITELLGTSVFPLGGDLVPGNNAGWKSFLIEPPASAPQVSINRELNGNVLTYFPSMAGFGFETKTELDAPWEPVPASQVTQENGTSFYTLPITASQAFVRVAETGLPLPFVDVFQESLDLGYVQAPFSDHGRVELSHDGKAPLSYFNFAYQNNWVIQNAPVVTLGTGKVEKISFNFPLAGYGVIVPNASYGFTLTTNPATEMPANASLGAVAPSLVFRRSGIDGQPLTYWPAQPFFGGMAGAVAKTQPAFPNREQGINECTPAAILNSLGYLNEVFVLGIPASELTMDNMKLASAWNSDGAPGGVDGPSWVEFKRQHMQDRGIPVQTEFTTDVNVAMEALQNSFAVELWILTHVAVVRSITETDTPGLYAITLADDTNQGAEGGARNRMTSYNSARRTADGQPFVGFVIQSPMP